MKTWFHTETFQDHNGQPSFVRKSLAWILLFAGALILLGVAMFGVVSLSVSKEIASFIIKALAAITGVVGIAYGAMQGAKGYAQGQTARHINPTPAPTDTSPPGTKAPAADPSKPEHHPQQDGGQPALSSAPKSSAKEEKKPKVPPGKAKAPKPSKMADLAGWRFEQPVLLSDARSSQRQKAG